MFLQNQENCKGRESEENYQKSTSVLGRQNTTGEDRVQDKEEQ